MVETLAPAGYARAPAHARCSPARRSRSARWPAARARSAALALLGAALGAGGPVALGAAAVVALAAAAGEARGARIVPAGPPPGARVVAARAARAARRRGYGVLLGLGFTTFILTFAVWALAGIERRARRSRRSGSRSGSRSAPAARCP